MRHVAALAALAAAVALSVPAIRHLREQPAPLPPAVRLSLTAPPGTELGAGDEPLDAAISPDQRVVVFVATQLRRGAPADAPIGTTQLWRRRLDAEEAEPLPGTEGARLPAFKQTGNVLSFFADERLKLLNLTTGRVTPVTEARGAAGATWLRDGSLLFVPGPGAVRKMFDGRFTNATELSAGDAAHVYPVAGATDQDFVYVAVRQDGRRVVRLSADGRPSDVGTTAAQAVPAGPGNRVLLFVQGTTLVADERNADTGRMAGIDLPIALNVGVTGDGRGLFVASPDLLIHAAAADRARRLTWLTLNGVPSGTVADVGDYSQVRVSPNDEYLAVTARDPLIRSLDVVKIPVDGRAPALRLTASLAADTDPVWAPDGQRLVFRSMQRGRPELLVTAVTIDPTAVTADLARPLKISGETATDWRGREMLMQVRGTSGFDLVRVDAAAASENPVARSPFNETDGRWSPDGRWIAYVSDESGRPDVYVVANELRQRVSTGGGTQPRWTRDSRALLFRRGSTIMRADLNGAGRFESPRPLVDVPGIRDFDVAHRSDRIVALLPVQNEAVSGIPVILNWRSLLEQASRRAKANTQRPVL
jgi:dipeptidyl aminopeptidase/acylaminoacyl peptidase